MASNTGDSWIKTLLDSLQSLYTKLSFVILNRRIHSYRKESGAVMDKQILSTLFDIVEKTPGGKNSKSVASEATPVTETDGLTSDDQKTGSEIKQRNAAPEMLHKDLSNHLHKSSDSGNLGSKLRASAWDHIHTSLRYVREEKPDLAKMHAGLANEALQQASHHMTDEQFTELKTSIMAELQKLREH